MNWLDLVILLVLGLEIFAGWREGLVGMVANLGGVVLGLWVAGRYSGDLATLLRRHLVGPAWLLTTLAFLAILLVSRYGLKLVGEVIKRAMAVPGLTTLDRLAGAGLGLCIGTLVVMLVVSFLAWLPWPYFTQVLQNSELGQYFWSAAPVFTRFLWQELAPVRSLPRILPGGQHTAVLPCFGRRKVAVVRAS